MKLRKLTEKGMKVLEKDLIFIKKSAFPKVNIDKYESKEISNVSINPNKKFIDKYDLGIYFLSLKNFSPDPYIWNWLSLLYFEQLLNKYGRIGETQRLFIFPKKSPYYPHTHLLKVPYDICKHYSVDPNNIKFFLRGTLNINSGVYLQITKRSEIMKNHHFMEVVKILFFDKKKGIFKRGSDAALERLIKVYKQYERGFDMYHMPSNIFLKKLKKKHKEFDKFYSRWPFKYL